MKIHKDNLPAGSMIGDTVRLPKKAVFDPDLRDYIEFPPRVPRISETLHIIIGEESDHFLLGPYFNIEKE